MGKAIDMTGKTCGRLTVIRQVESLGGHARWLCRCECGAETVATGSHLNDGHTTSCGCLRRDRTAERFTIHGQSMTKLHRVLRSIRMRCLNPKDPGYEYYGGRGIKVCLE